MKRTFSITTLGCKVNQYESEAMSELFEEKGYMKVDQETEVADIYIINTCTVTNLSDRKSRQVIRKAKRENPEAIVAVVGCYSQVSPEEVVSIEGVDIVLGTTERADIVNMVEDFQSNGQSINVVRSLDGDYEFQPINISKESDMTRAYMKVQDGCNRFCTYCIIPYARGRIRSRSIEDSVKEAKRLAEAGYKEIVLTGIHIGSYGKESGKNLIELIEEIAKVDGIERIRMSSVEPMTITEDFLKRAIAIGKFCDHFHLSLQSGCDKVLKEMNRRYTTEEYKAVVDLIRKYMPKAGITTDIIVGFPGETDEEFEVTCKFVEKVEFSRIHVFKYSMRDGTPAAKRTDQVHGQVKHERSQKLIELNEKLMKKFASEQDTLDVLFEEEIDGKFVGYSTNYLRCSIESQDDLKNITKSVKIVSNESEPFEVVLS
ncbi:tRNA (N(6)-L-threonylcarbamoyladenosine(37)-C(2))-methylthiotransferase MtaB [Peptoniphilus asaccharolyticus]